MKKTLIYPAILLSCAITFSCGNSNKESKDTEQEESQSEESVSEPIGAIKSLTALESKMKDIEKHMNELKSKTPLSNDILKQAIPESIFDLKRKSLEVGGASSMGLSNAEADYENADGTKTIELTITDGAGEAASAFISLAMMGYAADSEKTDDEGYEKTQEYKGHRAKLSEYTYDGTKESTIEWVYSNRFLVKLNGKGYSIEELGKAMESLNLSVLK